MKRPINEYTDEQLAFFIARANKFAPLPKHLEKERIEILSEIESRVEAKALGGP
jgi:hypothetical protein